MRGEGVGGCKNYHYLCTHIARWSSWQLIGLITRRSQVRVLPSQLCRRAAIVRPNEASAANVRQPKDSRLLPQCLYTK